MAKITDSLVSAFIDAMTTKEKKPPESYVFGVAQNTGDKKIRVKIDGGEAWYEMPSAVKVKDNDRVAVMIKNRKGTITSNVTSPSLNGSASSSLGTVQAAGETSYSTSVTLEREEPTLSAQEEGGTSGSGSYTASAVTTATTAVNTSDEKQLLIGELMTDDNYDVIKMGVNSADHKTQLQVPMIKTENFLNTSDRRQKTDIFDTDESNALGKVNQIKHRKYKWKSDGRAISLGYIAQEMGEIDPELEIDYGACAVNMSYLIPLMSKAIQELSAEVEDLRKEVKRLGETQNRSVSADEE